jgi:uncharacterized membrane protein YbaN (DUF454 family)
VGKTRKIIYITLGTIFVGLGAIGAVVPLMPTTVFLLLAAFFYSRSSDRFHSWLLHNRVFGEYLRNYQEGRGMTAKHKMRAIIVLWATIGLSMWLVPSVTARVVLALVASGVTIFLLLFVKTYRPDADRPSPQEASREAAASVE